MSDEIKTNTGRKVGEWDGNSVLDLQTEIGKLNRAAYRERDAPQRPAPGRPAQFQGLSHLGLRQ